MATARKALVVPMVVVLHPCEVPTLRSQRAPQSRTAQPDSSAETESAPGRHFDFEEVCALLEKLLASYSLYGAQRFALSVSCSVEFEIHSQSMNVHRALVSPMFSFRQRCERLCTHVCLRAQGLP
jgi:hypothetical protein